MNSICVSFCRQREIAEAEAALKASASWVHTFLCWMTIEFLLYFEWSSDSLLNASIYLSIHPSIRPSVHRSIYLSLSYPTLSYPILSYLVLSCLILCYLILSYLILSYVIILSYLILSCLILSYLILSCIIVSCLVLSYLVLPDLILSHIVLSDHMLSYLILSCLVLSYLILSYLILSYLILSYLILSYIKFRHLLFHVFWANWLTCRSMVWLLCQPAGLWLFSRLFWNDLLDDSNHYTLAIWVDITSFCVPCFAGDETRQPDAGHRTCRRLSKKSLKRHLADGSSCACRWTLTRTGRDRENNEEEDTNWKIQPSDDRRYVQSVPKKGKELNLSKTHLLFTPSF